MKTIRLRGEEYAEYMKNVDGYRRKLEKSYFDTFGAFRFTSPNGRLIGKPIREAPSLGLDSEALASEEREAVSDERMASEAEHIKRQRNSGLVQRAPNPRSCKCRDWPTGDGVEREYDATGKLKHHHPKCAWDKMYRRSTGTQIKNVAAGPTLESKIHHAGKVTNTAKVTPRALGKPGNAVERTKPAPGVPRPESCVKCKDFSKNRQAKAEEEKLGVTLHHVTCEYYKKHKALALAQKATGVKPEPVVMAPVSKQKVMLWDLTSQGIVRRAEAYEVETARKRLRDEGVALCEVDGNDYLVAFEDGESLEPADPAPEGAGQGPEGAGQAPGSVPDEHADTEPPGPPDVEVVEQLP